MTKASARADGATVLRSGGSFVLGILGSGFLLLLAVLFGWSRPVATGLALLGAAACHLLLTHPHVRLDEHAVTLANPVRWVRIPWGLLDEVTARLSLDVFTETQKFTSWAVSAKLERPTPSPGLPSSRDPGLAAASVARAPEGAATRAGEGAAMRGGSRPPNGPSNSSSRPMASGRSWSRPPRCRPQRSQPLRSAGSGATSACWPWAPW